MGTNKFHHWSLEAFNGRAIHWGGWAQWNWQNQILFQSHLLQIWAHLLFFSYFDLLHIWAQPLPTGFIRAKKIQATCFISELTFANLTYQSKKKSIRATCFTSELNLFQPDLSELSAACPALRYLPPSFDPAAVGFQIHIKPASCHSDISAGGLCNWIYQSCSLSLLLICSA